MDGGSHASLVTRIRALLAENPGLTLSETSETLKIERHRIESECRRLGSTFRQLRAEYRLHNAVRRLRDEPNAPIKAIAVELGYSSTRAFSRFFVRATGRQPRQLRSSHRTRAR
jgi:AraC-like DNA-binding protein